MGFPRSTGTGSELRRTSRAREVPASPFEDEWSDLLSAADRAFIEASGYGRALTLGHRPALLMIDFQYNYLGLDQPAIEQLGVYPTGGGSSAWQAMRRALTVLEAARTAGTPIVFSRIAYPADRSQNNTFTKKRGAAEAFIDGAPGTQLAADLAVRGDELVVTKENASAFFGTDLNDWLRHRGVDTVLITGLSTSGCVRATAVDAASHGLNVVVVADATADRVDLSRRVTLLDIWMKYGNLMSATNAAELLLRAAR